jgi:hypothetical protein
MSYAPCFTCRECGTSFSTRDTRPTCLKCGSEHILPLNNLLPLEQLEKADRDEAMRLHAAIQEALGVQDFSRSECVDAVRALVAKDKEHEAKLKKPEALGGQVHTPPRCNCGPCTRMLTPSPPTICPDCHEAVPSKDGLADCPRCGLETLDTDKRLIEEMKRQIAAALQAVEIDGLKAEVARISGWIEQAKKGAFVPDEPPLSQAGKENEWLREEVIQLKEANARLEQQKAVLEAQKHGVFDAYHKRIVAFRRLLWKNRGDVTPSDEDLIESHERKLAHLDELLAAGGFVPKLAQVLGISCAPEDDLGDRVVEAIRQMQADHWTLIKASGLPALCGLDVALAQIQRQAKQAEWLESMRKALQPYMVIP